MNIRTITRNSITASAIGIIALAGLSTGSAAAAELCVEEGPNGLPAVVECPFDIDLPRVGVPDVSGIIGTPIDNDALLAGGAATPANEPCTVTLPSGLTIDCEVIGMPGPITLDIIGELIDGTNPDIDADPAPEAPAGDDEGADLDDPNPIADPDNSVDVEGAELDAPNPITNPDNQIDVEGAELDAPNPITNHDNQIDVEGAELDAPNPEVGTQVSPEGALPRTGAGTMGIALGIGLMGLGGGAFAKLAATRRRS